jgi:protein-tyrosine phosphatase
VTTVRPQHVLFVCTGNYYRSRFAEALFNDRAERLGLPFRAFSRGLDSTARQHPGDVSPLVLAELIRLGIPLRYVAGRPTQLSDQDLARSDHVVAMDRDQHEPLFRARFPAVDPTRVRYWHVHDVDQTPPEEALSAISGHVGALIRDLSARRS